LLWARPRDAYCKKAAESERPAGPESGDPMQDSSTFGRGVALGLAAVAALLVVNAILSYQNVRQLNDDARGVAHTHETLDSLEELLGTLRDAETGQRGYLLTRNDQYLVPYNDALRTYQSRIARVERLTADNPVQQARVPKLSEMVAGRMKRLAETFALLKQGDAAAAFKRVQTGAGKRLMDDIRSLVKEMKVEEYALLLQRQTASDRAYAVAVGTGLCTALLGLLAVGAFAGLLTRHQRSRARAAAVIHRERETLQATLLSIGDGVIIADAEGRVTFLNAVAQQLTGWTSKEARGEPLPEVFHIVNEETRSPVNNPALRAMEEGRIVELANHTILIAKNGMERPIDDSAAPIRDGHGSLIGAVLVFRDITEKKQAEEQFRVLAENIPQLAWMARPDGHIFWYNRRWYEYTGTTPAQVEGWGWERVLDPEVLPKVLEQWRHSLATGTPFDMVFPLKGKDGVFRQFLTRIMPVKDAEGRVAQWFGTNTDVSKAKRAEEELRRLAAELSEADRRKNEFLATLAHELRNPLAPLRNGLQIMRLSGDSKAAVEQARTIMERQLGQMVHLVDDLLDVSRISRGKLDLRTERVELATVLNNAIETSRPLLDANGHELLVRLPSQPLFVAADVTRLGQVFANLLNNAAKYSERGKHIELTAERQGSTIAVRIQDSGVGIPADMLPRIFEIFTQVDQSLERSEGGLGIGLTLVKRLVEMHGGSVEAHSEGQGQGSEFIVRLPLASDEAQVMSDKTEDGSMSAPRAAPLVPGRRILVADDNVDSAASLAMLLTIMGNEVRTAHNGLEAVEVAAAFRPDAILMDIGMPKLNGYEACRHIREQPWGKQPLLIAVTGWGQEEDRQRSREAGFDHHMVKPIDPVALERVLAGLAPQTARGQAVPPPNSL
jgi:PAS domain S-box-containing protein